MNEYEEYIEEQKSMNMSNPNENLDNLERYKTNLRSNVPPSVDNKNNMNDQILNSPWNQIMNLIYPNFNENNQINNYNNPNFDPTTLQSNDRQPNLGVVNRKRTKGKFNSHVLKKRSRNRNFKADGYGYGTSELGYMNIFPNTLPTNEINPNLGVIKRKRVNGVNSNGRFNYHVIKKRPRSKNSEGAGFGYGTSDQEKMNDFPTPLQSQEMEPNLNVDKRKRFNSHLMKREGQFDSMGEGNGYETSDLENMNDDPDNTGMIKNKTIRLS